MSVTWSIIRVRIKKAIAVIEVSAWLCRAILKGHAQADGPSPAEIFSRKLSGAFQNGAAKPSSKNGSSTNIFTTCNTHFYAKIYAWQRVKILKKTKKMRLKKPQKMSVKIPLKENQITPKLVQKIN